VGALSFMFYGVSLVKLSFYGTYLYKITIYTHPVLFSYYFRMFTVLYVSISQGILHQTHVPTAPTSEHQTILLQF